MNLTPAEYQKLTKRGVQKIPRATKLSQPLSEGEETLAQHLKANKIAALREFRFCTDRKWRLDFGILPEKLGIEVEGGTKGKSRHTQHDGFEKDNDKYNTATIMGWRILRFSTDQVVKGHAITTIKAMLGLP